jgi:hypothetical protein
MGERCCFGRDFGFAVGLCHAEQPELVELVEGRMGKHVVSSMIVAAAPYVAMKDRHAVRFAAVGSMAIEIVVEDGFD